MYSVLLPLIALTSATCRGATSFRSDFQGSQERRIIGRPTRAFRRVVYYYSKCHHNGCCVYYPGHTFILATFNETGISPPR